MTESFRDDFEEAMQGATMAERSFFRKRLAAMERAGYRLVGPRETLAMIEAREAAGPFTSTWGAAQRAAPTPRLVA